MARTSPAPRRNLGKGSAGLLAAVLALVACSEDAELKPATLVTVGDGGGGDSLSDAAVADGGAETAPTDGPLQETEDTAAADLGDTDDAIAPLDAVDTSNDTAVGEDAATQPQNCPGDPGCPCKLDSECGSGACLASAKGPACAAPCVADVPCAKGTACFTLPGADTTTSDDDIAVCAPKWATFCDPCELSSACTGVGAPQAACIGLPGAQGQGFFCAPPCKNDSQCPTGATCSEATGTDGLTGGYCVPTTGLCTCSAAALGKSTACSVEVTLPSGATAICAGTRICGENGLSACSAATPKAEICNGLDDDCNGQTDEGAACDDGNPCTKDACSLGKCAGVPQAALCDDGSACTAGDACLDGTCAGAPVSCDDSNPCTGDSCDNAKGCQHTALDGGTCDDGDVCTAGDTCKAGACVATQGNACPCSADSDCVAKEDGNLCNGTLYCNKAKVPAVCTVNPATVVVCDPKADSVCAAATCEPSSGKCALAPKNAGAACSDNNACTAADACAGGTCTGAAVNCDDGNACTADSCDPASGCKHANTGDPCSDDNPCTTGDICSAGACLTVPKGCDDGFACTDDACDITTGNCQNNLVASTVCGVVPLPFVTDLACDATATLALWQRSDWALPTSAVRWGFDNSPELVANGTCSLNINNGKDLSCSSGQTLVDAYALSPWLDAAAVPVGKPLAVRFDSGGSWTPQHVATVAARISGGEWIALGSVAAPTGSGWTGVQFPITGMAGKQLQIRFAFSGPCAAGQLGWFVDNVAVFADACADGSTNCPANHTCTSDSQGKAVCTPCQPGFQVNGNVCVDVDECAVANTCSANATCTNTVGSYVCTCKPGFEGATCSDVDECANGTAGCEATAVCVNKPGSFSCTCPSPLVAVGKGCAKKGTVAAAPAATCVEILGLDPTSGDGNYWLDVDGPGGQPAAQYYCDMKGGGWVLLIFDTFDTGSAAGWSAGSVQGCGSYGPILGGANQFGKGALTSKKVAAPAHSQVKLALAYVRIDSWDGESGVVQVDGNNVWTKKGTGAWHPLFHDGDVCGDNAYTDDEWGVAFSGPHSGATVTVTVTSTLDQDAGDESFGVDNVALWVK